VTGAARSAPGARSARIARPGQARLRHGGGERAGDPGLPVNDPPASQAAGLAASPVTAPGAELGAAPAANPVTAPGAEPGADPEAVARQICLRLLASAPRTRAELAAALSRRGVPDAAAEAVLARFAEVKLIDDATFARAWVESRHHGRGLAGRALAGELRRKGVPAEDIEAAVGGLDPEQEVATARALVARRLAASTGQPQEARIRRAIGGLARKGYSQALAYRLVREALEAEGSGLAGAWPEEAETSSWD